MDAASGGLLLTPSEDTVKYPESFAAGFPPILPMPQPRSEFRFTIVTGSLDIIGDLFRNN